MSCYYCKPTKKDHGKDEGDGGDPEPEPEPEVDTCFDDDQCLVSYYGADASCAGYAEEYFCEEEDFIDNMAECCPVSCYYCKPTDKGDDPKIPDDVVPEPEVDIPLTYSYVGCYKDDSDRDGEYGPMEYGYD